MTQVRFYFDENRNDPRVIRPLRAEGIDIVSAFDLEMISRPDAEHLELATHLGRALVTEDAKDFGRLHTEYMRTGRTHARIIIVTQWGLSPGEQIRRLLRLAEKRSAEEMHDWLEHL